MSFLEKFFGYYNNDSGIPEPFKDDLGLGAFTDYRHFVWIFLVIVLGIGLYHLFKKYPKAGKITVMVLLGLLFVTRLSNQIFRAAIGAEVPGWRAFPFHLCTIMTFMLPIVYYLKLKPLKTAVYVLSMMGGIITVIIGDYFDSRFMTFSTLEGITAHTILILVPIIEIAIGNFKLEIKKIWQVYVGAALLIGWASLANEVFFKAYDTNYMYLKRNGLPGNLGGNYYFLIYMAIFIIMTLCIFGIPFLKEKFKKAK